VPCLEGRRPPCRLLKGGVPGRQQRNFYTTELGVLKNSKNFVRSCQADHLAEVQAGIYRDGGSGYGGPAADQSFYDPEKVAGPLCPSPPFLLGGSQADTCMSRAGFTGGYTWNMWTWHSLHICST
jgi:hypothetical protein